MTRLRLYRVLWFLAFVFAWVACTTRPARVVPERPRLLGEPGETAMHFSARLVTRTCTANEIPALVDAVQRRLAECEDLDGACEERICAELRTEPITAEAR